MKNIKKIINLSINKFALIGLMICVAMVYGITVLFAATNSSKYTFDAPSTSFMGNNLTVKLNLTNITGDPVSGLSGRLSFDESALELVSATGLSGAFTVTYNSNTKKFTGITFSGSNLTSNTTLITLVFRPKKVGNTTITVTEPDASTGSRYTPTVEPKTIQIVQPSTDAWLTNLTTSVGTLSPAFNKDTTAYTINVASTVSSLKLTATPVANATVTANGVINCTNLREGENKYTITVTAQDGTTKKNYVVTVIKEKAPAVASSDNNLKGLSVDGYTISPAFNANTTDYNLTIPFEATSVKVNATKNHDKASVVINGMDNLQVGDNKVTVVVTAEDGSKKTYTINVKREEKVEVPPELDGDSTLKGISVSEGTLSPSFSTDNSTYTLEVGDTVNSIDVSAIPNSDKAKVEVTGNTNLKTGFNAVEVTVTAEDGSKSKYIINVYKKEKQQEGGTTTIIERPKLSNNNYLSSLSVDGTTLNPKFNKDVVSYNVTVPYDVSKLDIKYTIEDGKKAKAEILDNEPLKVGEVKQIYVKVTAEDGSVRMYTINATRSALSSNAYLKELSAKGFNLNESFDKNKLSYTMNVDANTKSLDLRALAENDKAKVEILGNSNLKVGSNMLMVSVTDENGFSKIYQLNVIKPEATILGLSRATFFTMLAFALGLLGLILLLAFILSRRKKEEPVVEAAPAPTIDFKPEFNFGSRNGTDDDVVYPGGILNQGNGSMDQLPSSEPKKLVGTVSDANYSESSAPFDYFDDTITKDELIAAIKEGMDTKNSDKLKMLLRQEELNKMKKEIKDKEGR